MVDLQLLVNEDVPEASPAAKKLREIVRQFSRVFENGERVSICVRSGEAAVGDPVISQIEGGLDGEVEIALSEVMQGGVAEAEFLGEPSRNTLSFCK